MKIAVITGASSGMGREFVYALDKQFEYDEIWVIARRKDRLEALSSGVRSKIRAISLDLTRRECIDEFSAMLKAEQPEIKTLVNCSGFGRFEAFENVELSEYYRMVDLNCSAYVGMTYVCLPYMREGGEIYQLDSLSSFQPVPYINVYGATKAFVLSFSRALNVELKKRKIKCMAVCPGWVKTEFFDHAVTDDSVITYYNKIFTPEQVITRALKDMKRGRDVSVVGFSIRMQVLATKLLPHGLVMKIWCKQQKK
jgi:short-subunit dehydrogenase